MHLHLPGDKSISHRALILAALADGTSHLTNLSPGDDVDATRSCLEQCGIRISAEGEVVIVAGRGGDFQTPDEDLVAGNSGTTARLLAGMLAGRGIQARLTGDASLSRRPMERVAEPLRQMGADIELSPAGTLPLELRPACLGSLTYTLPVASAQVKSALLLAGLASEGVVNVIEPVPTRNHTELMLQALGVDIQVSGDRITLGSAKRQMPAFDLEIPGDPSSAAFLATLAILLPDMELTFDDLLLNPTRMGFFRALQRMGGQIIWTGKRRAVGEETGSLTVQSSSLKGIEISGAEIPALIDELPILAILASQAEGVTVVRDAGELRVKESDRIRAICENLGSMGGQVEELSDGFRIRGPISLKGAAITTYGDHRIAMAFSVAGYLADGETALDDPDCVAISFPDFHNLVQRVVS
ncbi:MAG: 3-phosphoshikimate 1-carboxyvinyltransferase [Fidelibacterota bacterium]|nr:MAG: 3-phosphoshikimate 1-carboxyvinyltransferase [Candidatus Neomarinimicrobiota bacterium]